MEAEINFSKLFYSELNFLLGFQHSKSSIIDSLNNEMIMFENSPSTLYLEKSTLDKYRVFKQKFLNYLSNFSYGDDEIFTAFDAIWHQIIKNYLLPVLESMEQDFEKHGIEYTSYKITYDPDARPSDEDILERGRTLYGLLLKHKVIKRYYLDE